MPPPSPIRRLTPTVLLGLACASPTPPRDGSLAKNSATSGAKTEAAQDGGSERSCSDPNVDYDGDGFLDESRSRAFRPDIYVQLDVMDCTILDERVVRRLKGPVRERLEEQFAAAPVASRCAEACGMQLHLQINRIDACDDNVHKTDFICDRNLPDPTHGSQKNKRHVLWGDRFTGKSGLHYSGLTSGRRIFVSLGDAYRRNLSEADLVQLESSVLMHELGHSFGLTHGHPACSREDVEKRGCDLLPNHLSVMSRHWMATGVAHGVADGKPAHFEPTFQAFDTETLLEEGGERVAVRTNPGRCTAPLEAPPLLRWVRYGTGKKPVPVSTPVPGEKGRPVDLNGDNVRGQTLWGAAEGRASGIPNEWRWIVEHESIPPSAAARLSFEDAALCIVSRFTTNKKSMIGDPIINFDHVPDEPTVDLLILDLLGTP